MAVVAGEIDADLLHIAHDTALTAKIMAKRRAEMQRRTKLLDPRTRQRGTDHDALGSHIMGNLAQQERERDEEAYHARAAVLQEQVAQAFESMHAKGVRDRHTAAVEYSLDNLGKEQRREYHLSDPNELKNERILTHEELDQMGPASCLTLGEDPEEMARKKHEQRMETKMWLNQQKEDRLNREVNESEIDRQFDGEMQFANHVRTMCEETARQEAIEETYATAAENQAIAENHYQRKVAQAEKNSMNNLKHTGTIMNSDQLKEAHEYQIGSTGKLVRTEYRRATMDELQGVHDTNAYQVIDKRAKAEALKAEDRAARAVLQQDVDVREAIELRKKQAVVNRRKEAEEYNRSMAAAKSGMSELTREGVR